MRIVRDAGAPRNLNLPVMHDDFSIEVVPGTKRHICIVMDVLGMDIATLRRSARQKALAVHVVKGIIKQILTAAANLHKLGFVHTGELGFAWR